MENPVTQVETQHVLQYSRINHYLASNGLVPVHSVRNNDRRYRPHREATGAKATDEGSGLGVQLLVADGIDDIADEEDDAIRQQRRETNLCFAHAVVLE
ncbi:hypothetical protein LTR17_027858, partial [Elasticomyces elasticus]